ncbi:hypothetical protein J7L68_05520 [bacterium]|nr:hypothetical protein [bacterium]
MRSKKVLFLFFLIAVGLIIDGCACNQATQQGEQGYGDLMVGVIVTQPLSYYYGTTGYLEIWGPDGIYLSKEIPMYLGNQVAIFRNLPIGRYIASLSYSGMVTTKCAVLCGMGDVQWRADCANGLKQILTNKQNTNQGYGGKSARWNGWAQNKEQSDFVESPCPAGGHREPCQTSIIFKMPEDALKYDP